MSLPAPFSEVDEQIAIELPGAKAVFTTRRGGHSQPPYDTLNLGFLTDDARDNVTRNRAWLQERFGVKLAYGHQVHGNSVRVAGEPTVDGSELIKGDGIATTSPGLAALVLSADCLPVVIAGGGVVAAVHAGWKGLHRGVVAEGVRAVRELSGSADPELHAAVGPAAGVCCYEVSDELHERFSEVPGYACRGRNLDLKSIAHAQLREAGVSTVNDVGLCTICADRTLFFSHRRDKGITGRQGAIAWLT